MRLFVIALVLTLFSPSFAQAQIEDEIKNPHAKSQMTDSPMQNHFNLGMVQQIFNNSQNTANIKTWQYKSSEIFKLKLREFMNTTVELPAGEIILAFSLGDKKNFGFSALKFENEGRKNMFEVWGKYPGADTSLKVYGKYNTYVFYVRVDSVQSANDPHLMVYVEDPNIKPAPQPETTLGPTNEQNDQYTPKAQNEKLSVDYLRELGNINPADLDFGYMVSDPDSKLAPLRVFSDKNWTWFQFGTANLDQVQSLPVVYAVKGKYDNPINNRIQGGFIVVETTSDAWTIRSDDEYVCVKKRQN